MPKKPQPKKPGRPKVDIDWAKVGQMCEAGATAEGIAATLGCDRDTLYIRCKKDLNLDYSAFSQQKRSKGDDLLRVKQFQKAMSGDNTMMIWLGKQRLNQSDKSQTELTGKDGGPVDVATRVILPK
jgi:hypothetical protein